VLDRSDPDDCCLRVCLSVGYKGEPCKNAKPIEMPFGGLTREGQRNHLLDGVEIPKGKRQFVELSGPSKNTVSHCCGLRSKTAITVSARLQQPTAFLPTVRCHSNFSLVKNCPMQRGLSSKFFDHRFQYVTATGRHVLELTDLPQNSEVWRRTVGQMSAITENSCKMGQVGLGAELRFNFGSDSIGSRKLDPRSTLKRRPVVWNIDP